MIRARLCPRCFAKNSPREKLCRRCKTPLSPSFEKELSRYVGLPLSFGCLPFIAIILILLVVLLRLKF